MSNHLLTFPASIPSDPGFSLHKRVIPAGTQFPLHWHDYYEFEMILSGQGEHTYNGLVYEVGPGSAYLMCYQDFHALKANTEIVLYNIIFDQTILSSELASHLEFHKFHHLLSREETTQITKNLLRMEEEAGSKQPFYKNVIENALSDIIITMFRKSSIDISHITPLPIQQTISYLNENFRQNLTLNEMAKLLSFSPNYFGKLFKEEIGTTFHEYLNTLRLKYACNLLSVSKLSTKEVAYSSGYNSIEYFLYVFKKKLQMTPSQYREAKHRWPES